MGHIGQEPVLSSLRREFWVIKGRRVVWRVVQGCMGCQRSKAGLREPFMANLPESRVTRQQPSSTSVRVDFFGPYFANKTRTVQSEKIWGQFI